MVIILILIFLLFSPANVEALNLFPIDTFQGILGLGGPGEKEWKAIGFGIIGTISLLSVDGDLFEVVQNNKTPASEKITKYVGPLGSGTVAIPGLIGGYLLAREADYPLLKQATIEAWDSFVISGLVVTLGKQITHRHRPSSGEGPYQWEGSGFSTQNLSFPSGHSATAFSIATSFAGVYRDEYPWVPYLAYSLATIAAFSRVHDNHHWPSDVFAGSLIGWGIARQVRHFHEQEEKAGKWRIGLSEGFVLRREWTF